MRSEEIAMTVTGVWLVWAVTAGCNSDRSTDPRLERAEAQLAAQQAKLASIQNAITEAEKRLEKTKAQADFQACRAKVKEMRADIERRKAECAKEVADQSLCLVRNEKRTAEAGLSGCTAGIIWTALSGGTAAWSLAGCAAGVGSGKMMEDRCPVPACANALDQITSQVLAARGLTSIPRCGGYAGFQLGDLRASQEGMKLERIGQGTYAESSGLLPGDTIIVLNGTPTTSLDSLRLALDTSREGQPLIVRFVRGDRVYEGQAAATRVGFNGIADDLQVGAEVTAVTASYCAGAGIESLSPEGPARSAGLAPGDQLLTLSVPGQRQPATIATADDAERAMEDCGPFDTVTFNIARGPERLSIAVPLKPRGAEQSL